MRRPMPLEIDAARARYMPDAGDRVSFRKQHWIRLPAFLDALLVKRIERALANTAFEATSHHGGAGDSTDLRAIGVAITEMLVLFCNDREVLRAVEDITGCGALTRFNGSIYRMLPERGHQQEWHDDLVDGRVVALTANIGLAAYEGGALEIRERDTRRTIAHVPNTVPGDAVLFELDRSLEHRVTPVTSGVKTAFAGWFRRGTPLGDELRRGSVQLRR